MVNADSVHLPLTNRQVRERRRYLVASVAGKIPVDGWEHPRPKGRRRHVSNRRTDGRTGAFAVTSNTPDTWVTYAEAWHACMELGAGRLPGYVHSGKHGRAEDANRGLAFLDIDIHADKYEDDPEHLYAWRDVVVGELAALIGEIPVMASVSGEGRHILFVLEGDWAGFFDGGKKESVESPYGAEAAQIELWTPSGGGRYRVETGNWVSGGQDTEIPRLTYAEFMGLPSVAAWEEKRQEELEREERQSKYPVELQYERSYRGAAYRLARVGYDVGRPLLIAGDNLYVQRDLEVTNGVFERVGTTGEELLELQDRAIERYPTQLELEGYGPKVVDSLRTHLERNSGLDYARQAVPIIRSARRRGRPPEIRSMVSETAVRSMNRVNYRSDDGGGPVFVFNDCVLDIGLWKELDESEIRRLMITTDAPRIDLDYAGVAGASARTE